MAELTRYEFMAAVRAFLKELLKDPVEAVPNSVLKGVGLTKEKLIKMMIAKDILRKEVKIRDEKDSVALVIRYRVPRKNFDRKLRRLYSKVCEVNLPERMVEDGEGGGEGGGATSADASGQFLQPMSKKPIRREILKCSKGSFLKMIEEETTTTNVGRYENDAPAFGDKETRDHKNMMAKSWQGRI